MTQQDELTYYLLRERPPRTGLRGIVVAPVSAGPISWERTRPEWAYDRKGMYAAISKAGMTPIPPERLSPTQPVQPIDRATAVRLAAEMGLALPAEPDLWVILRAGLAQENSQRWQASLIRAYGRPTTSLGMRTGFRNTPEENQTTFYASYPTDSATEPTGVAMVQPWRDFVRAVAWAPRKKRWVFAGSAVQTFLLDPDNSMQKEVIDRATAEQISLRVNKAPLPTDEEITRICDEAIAKLPGGRMSLDRE